MYKKFTRDSMLLKEDDPEIPYERRHFFEETEFVTAVWGQRKLLMMELLFFTYFWDPKKIPRPHVLYIGSAPGNHIKILSDIYSDLTFHLYDPTDFTVETTPRIIKYPQLFKDEDAKLWSGRMDVFFISDIRRTPFNEENNELWERTITEDMNMQWKWCKMIRPVYFHLKFRLPNTIKSLEYVQGEIFKQPWVRINSTECRIIGSDPDRKKVYDIPSHYNRMYYHNLVIRGRQKFMNPVTNDETPIWSPELLNDYDSTYEAFLLLDVMKKIGIELTLRNLRLFSRYITVQLNRFENLRWKTLSTLRKRTRYFYNMKAMEEKKNLS